MATDQPRCGSLGLLCQRVCAVRCRSPLVLQRPLAVCRRLRWLVLWSRPFLELHLALSLLLPSSTLQWQTLVSFCALVAQETLVQYAAHALWLSLICLARAAHCLGLFRTAHLQLQLVLMFVDHHTTSNKGEGGFDFVVGVALVDTLLPSRPNASLSDIGAEAAANAMSTAKAPGAVRARAHSSFVCSGCQEQTVFSLAVITQFAHLLPFLSFCRSLQLTSTPSAHVCIAICARCIRFTRCLSQQTRGGTRSGP